MKKNMGTADRIFRVLFAGVVTVLFFMKIITGTLGIVLLVAGGILLLTSLVNFCPIYAFLGLKTRKSE